MKIKFHIRFKGLASRRERRDGPRLTPYRSQKLSQAFFWRFLGGFWLQHTKKVIQKQFSCKNGSSFEVSIQNEKFHKKNYIKYYKKKNFQKKFYKKKYFIILYKKIVTKKNFSNNFFIFYFIFFLI